MKSFFKKPVFWLILGVFVVSVSYSFYFQIRPAVDAKAYDKIAQNLAKGFGYRESLEVPVLEDNSIVRVGPGYEFFLAGVYKIFGRNLGAVWTIQALLLALSALLAYLSAREVFSRLKEKQKEATALFAAALVGFSPDLVTVGGMLMSEVLGVFFISLTTYLFFLFLRSSEKPLWLVFLFSAFFAFAAMTRTPSTLLALPVAFYFFRGWRWKEALVALATIVIIFAPWVARNYQVYGAFVPTNLAYGVDLLFGNHLGASGELEHYELPYENIKKYGYAEGNKKNAKEALRFIAGNPLEFLKITFYRASIYFSFARPTGFWFHLEGFSKAATLALSALYSAVIFILGFLGVSLFREFAEEDKKVARYLSAFILMAPLSVIFIVVETRYRFLIYPLLSIFAGYAFSDLAFDWKNWRGAKLRGCLIIILLLLANAGFDAGRNFETVIEKINDFG